MTKTNHTPGPLEFASDVQDTFMVFDPSVEDASSVTARGIKIKADARLYAAAPELLLELHRAVQALEAHGFTQLAGTARIAIAKATSA